MTQSQQTLRTVERIAKLLDNQFKIGPFKFGLDPIIGLIPGLGDIIPALFAGYLISLAYQEKLSPVVIRQMIANTIIDLIIGTVPIAGDIGDFFFKASERNMKLLKVELLKKDQFSGTVVLEGEVVD